MDPCITNPEILSTLQKSRELHSFKYSAFFANLLESLKASGGDYAGKLAEIDD